MLKNLSMEGLGISGRQSEVIELALSFGFRGIDLDMEDFAEQVDLYGLPHARRLIDSARIQIGTFRLPVAWQEWEDEDVAYRKGLENLPKIAELAAGLGCARCVTKVKPASDERPYHENFEFHRRRLSEIAEILEPRGIALGLEFFAPGHLRKGRAFQFIHTFEALVQLAKATARDNIGVAVDLWQVHVGGEDLEAIRELPAERILAVYLSDLPEAFNVEEVEESSRLMPGETGVIDCAADLTTLADYGFNGPVSPRAGRRALSGKKRDAIVQLAHHRFEQIWKAAGLDSRGNLSPTVSS